jgi:hypothetical protein
MANTPQDIFTAIKLQLSVIDGAGDFQTRIGTQIYLGEVQRTGMEIPSIAIGTRAGLLDRTQENRGGRALSSKARQIDLIIEAAMESRPLQFLQDGLLMLEDIERAWAIRTGLAAAPIGSVRLTSWSILDRPDGLDRTVLQILGEAEYLRA